MCSVVTNLVTSLEFQPIRCATTLLHFGRPRDVYVTTRIILLSSTAEDSVPSTQTQCRQLKREKDQTRNNTISANNNNGSAQTEPNPSNKIANNTKGNNINNQRDRRPRPVFPPCETCGRTNHSTEKCYFGANAANRPPP